MTDDERHSVAERPPLLTDETEIAHREAANALRQFDAVLDKIDEVARDGRPFCLRPSLILTLHRFALDGLDEFAGVYRNGPVHIGKSKHEPPPAHLVPSLMEEMVDWVNDNWEDTPLKLCAYVMWRLNWIHPFTDGNGRTSRAVAYMVLCCRLGDRLPGRKTIPELIAEHKAPYYDALEKADAGCADGNLDQSALINLLEGYLAKQLKDVYEVARAEGLPLSSDRVFH